jgi:hypothetical protein
MEKYFFKVHPKTTVLLVYFKIYINKSPAAYSYNNDVMLLSLLVGAS